MSINGRSADVRIPLDVLEVLGSLRTMNFTLVGIASTLTLLGYPQDAGKVRGIAEAVALERAEILAESERRRQEARSHG